MKYIATIQVTHITYRTIEVEAETYVDALDSARAEAKQANQGQPELGNQSVIKIEQGELV